MIDEEFSEIIERSVEGSASSEELARLEKYLELNSEAREYYKRLLRMSEIMGRAEEADPPPDLKANIMATIKRQRNRPKQHAGPVKAFLINLRESFNRRSAVAFSLGTVFGIFILAVLVGFPGGEYAWDDSAVSGTMTLNMLDKYETIDRKTFGPGESRNLIEVKRRGDIIAVNIEIQTKDIIRLSLTYDATDIFCTGIINRNQSAPEFSASAGRIEIAHQGNDIYTLIFNDNDERSTDISIVISTDDKDEEIRIATD